jgi:hypothetical protein
MDNNDSLGSPVPPAPYSPLRGDFVPVYAARMMPDPKWIEGLKRRQEAILQLSRGLRAWLKVSTHPGVDDICAAIEFLLGHEITEQLERMVSIQAQPIPPPTLEDMERAQQSVEQVQNQLDALDKMVESLPEASAEFINSVQRPMLESNLKHAQAWLSEIQRAMEASA